MTRLEKWNFEGFRIFFKYIVIDLYYGRVIFHFESSKNF